MREAGRVGAAIAAGANGDGSPTPALRREQAHLVALPRTSQSLFAFWQVAPAHLAAAGVDPALPERLLLRVQVAPAPARPSVAERRITLPPRADHAYVTDLPPDAHVEVTVGVTSPQGEFVAVTPPATVRTLRHVPDAAAERAPHPTRDS